MDLKGQNTSPRRDADVFGMRHPQNGNIQTSASIDAELKDYCWLCYEILIQFLEDLASFINSD